MLVRSAWANDTAADVLGVGAVIGQSPLFTGPPGATFTLVDDAAAYQTISAGTTRSCAIMGDCYSVGVSDPAVRPAAVTPSTGPVVAQIRSRPTWRFANAIASPVLTMPPRTIAAAAPTLPV